jgi:hypothetical protein
MNSRASHAAHYSLRMQNRTYQRWDPNPRFTNDTIKQLWDKSKSPSVNLANMGLVCKPNQDVKRSNNPLLLNKNKDADTGENVVQLFDIPESDTMTTRKERPLKEDDQKYIARCMSKHGDEYGKIFRDHKLNTMQHTESQLRKMGARFLLLSSEQRVVDVPGKVKMLIQE